jgi:cytochrome c biogenesis factor
VILITDQFDRDGSIVLKVAVNPLIDLIWLAGIVFLLGSVVAVWPDAREQRQLARRSLEIVARPVAA